MRPAFVFINGRTGETLHTETFREEILYIINQSTPALSSYFELMDRLLPTFLNSLSAQKIRGTRVLLNWAAPPSPSSRRVETRDSTKTRRTRRKAIFVPSWQCLSSQRT